jgi:hypothetical protein
MSAESPLNTSPNPSIFGLESYYFCYLGAHAKLQNPMTTLSGRISNEPERERGGGGEKNAIYSGHLHLCQQPRAAHALPSDQNVFLAAMSSSRSDIVTPSVRLSVCNLISLSLMTLRDTKVIMEA